MECHDALLKAMDAFCEQQGFDKIYWIAYSGGLDSHVLLDLFAKIRERHSIKLHIIHINHQLSPNAKQWALHCKNVCAQYHLDYIEKTIDAKAVLGESPEDAARQRRYQLLSKLLNANDLLLTAHQQDDQAETVLLQLFRGAGPKGLAAMPFIKPLGKGWHMRPLLAFSRQELQEYALANHLQWIEDESNSNIQFTRNFLRHEIFPILKQRWPNIANTLSRTALHCAEAQQVLTTLSWQDLVFVKGSVTNTLSIKKLKALDEVRQRYALRAWLEELHFPIPSRIKLCHIQQEMLYARQDKRPYFTWRGIELRRYRDDLYAIPCLSAHDPHQVYEWDLQNPLTIPGIGVLRVEGLQGLGLGPEVKQVTIRFRHGGEKMKKYFQELGVPPWERDRVPLVYVGGRLVGVMSS